MKKETFEIQDLDVWGNEEEGWEVNASYRIGKIELSLGEYENDDYIISQLIEKEFLTEYARKIVEVEGDGGFLTIINTEQGNRPLYNLVLV